VTTLTGRLPLGKVIWADSQETRVFGAGYGAFFTTKRTISLASILEWYPGHSHNAYLETIVDLGFLGLAILLWLIGASFLTGIQLNRSTGNDAYIFVSALMAAGVIDGFVEVMFVSVRDLGLYVGISISLLMLRSGADKKSSIEAIDKPSLGTKNSAKYNAKR
jgi:O-antigen ligase